MAVVVLPDERRKRREREYRSKTQTRSTSTKVLTGEAESPFVEVCLSVAVGALRLGRDASKKWAVQYIAAATISDISD